MTEPTLTEPNGVTPTVVAGVRRSTRLKELIHREGSAVVLNGPSTVRVATLMEALGAEVIYVGAGNVLGGILGRPNDSTITMTESVLIAKWYCDALSIPVWIDVDAGFGGPPHVERTVRELAAIGIAGMTLEDHPFVDAGPEHRAGAFVIPLDEAVEKYRCAAEVRDSIDPDIQLAARCGALGAANGGGIEGTVERLRAYRSAGADISYVDVHSLDELTALRDAIDGPLMTGTAYLARDLLASDAASLSLCAVHSRNPTHLLQKLERATYSAFLSSGAGAVRELDARLSVVLREMGLI